MLLEGPPGFFAVVRRGAAVAVVGGVVVVHLTGTGLIDEMTPLLATGDHTVDGAPVGETTEVPVIDEEIDTQFAGEVLVACDVFLGEVAVDCPELHAAIPTPLNGLVQKPALADGPENQLVSVADEHPEGLRGERDFRTYLGVTMLDNRTVKINCN